MEKHELYNHTGLTKNNKSHVLYALVDKQNCIKSFIQEYEAKIIEAKSNLIALQQTICIFDENCKKIPKFEVLHKVKRKRTHYFENGECKNIILTVLRTANKSLTTSEISIKVQEIKLIDRSDNTINKNFQRIIIQTLKNLEKNNLVHQVGLGEDGLSIIWSIKALEEK